MYGWLLFSVISVIFSPNYLHNQIICAIFATRKYKITANSL